MTYIFCDIDGVLNYANCDCDISKEKVILLKQIIDRTGAKLIINSKASWLKFIYEKRIKTIEEYGLHIDDQIIRTTLSSNSKAVECLAYLNRHEDVDNVLILDDIDDDYSLFFKNNFLLVNSKTGLTEKNTRLALKILNNEQKCNI